MMTKLLRVSRLARFGRQAAILVAIAALGAVSTPAKADTLNGGIPVTWNPNFLYNNSSYIPGLYYWNNDSGDGHTANIGWCLVGSSQCGMQNPPGHIPFYATALDTAPTDLYFSSSGQSLQLTLDLTLTTQKNGGSGTDFFGYYLTDAAGTPTSAPVVLFNSSQSLGSTAFLSTLTAGQNYAFFIENIQGYGTNAPQTDYTFYMNSGKNASTGSMPADNIQHFAIFQIGSTFYIGSTDGDACAGPFTVSNSPCIPASEFDYNDMVVQVSPVTPEPASIGLVALGIIALAVIARRGVSAALR
jgi:hypothetical protein